MKIYIVANCFEKDEGIFATLEEAIAFAKNTKPVSAQKRYEGVLEADLGRDGVTETGVEWWLCEQCGKYQKMEWTFPPSKNCPECNPRSVGVPS